MPLDQMTPDQKVIAAIIVAYLSGMIVGYWTGYRTKSKCR